MNGPRLLKYALGGIVLFLAYVFAAQSSASTNVFDRIAWAGSPYWLYLIGSGVFLILVPLIWLILKRR